MLSTNEVMHRLHISRATLYDLISTGKIDKPEIIGTRKFWTEASVQKCEQERRFSLEVSQKGHSVSEVALAAFGVNSKDFGSNQPVGKREPLYSSNDVAERLHIDATTLYAWIKAGKFPKPCMVIKVSMNKRPRFSWRKSVVEAYIKAQKDAQQVMKQIEDLADSIDVTVKRR